MINADAGGNTSTRRQEMVSLVRAAIIAGDMEPGQVYSAPSIASRFGVSATPVREAMIDLAKEGLVTVSPNKGFRVSFPSISQLRSILDVRLLLEVPTVVQVAEHGISRAEYDDLRRPVVAGLSAAGRGDLAGLVQADLDFHLALLALAGNPDLVEIVSTLRSKSRLGRWRTPARHETLMESAREHEQLLELVRKGDLIGVRALMTQHIAHLGGGIPAAHGAD